MKQKSNLARCYVVSLSKIDAVEEYISSLIQNKQENEFVDFKQFYYHEDKKYDLIKDIAVVDFYATWCGPCKMFGPVFEEVSKESNINFVKIDVDKENDIARRYGVMTIPTVILFKNGEEVKRNIGYMSEEELIDFMK